MEQENLFHEDIYDALRSCVSALGGAKKLGSQIWGELSPEKAGNRLNDCLNTSRREQLNPEQVLFILNQARQVNCHAAMYFISDHCDYKRPEPIEPVDEIAKLQRDYIEMAKRMEKIAESIQHVQTLKAVNS